MTVEVAVFDSIAAIRRSDWERCFPGEIESWDYYRAVEDAGIPGFEWRYFAVCADQRPLAVVPGFITTYRLDASVQGRWKRVTERLVELLPWLLSIRLACLGSPVAEVCHLGFAPEIAERQKPELLRDLIAELKRFAEREGIGLIGIKDAPSEQCDLWSGCLPDFKRLPGLATALLPLPYGDFDAYLKSLSRATRKDMKRKLRAGAGIRMERRTNIDDVLPRVLALYEETVARSDLQFEQLPGTYFANVLASMKGRAYCLLCWLDAELLAFNLVLESPGRLVDKFVGLHYPVVRTYNLYFLTWMANVRYCIEQGIPVYQSGQAAYAPKLRLGCRLRPNWQFFRHRNPLLNVLLRWVSHLVRMDRFDPELQSMLRGVK